MQGSSLFAMSVILPPPDPPVQNRRRSSYGFFDCSRPVRTYARTRRASSACRYPAVVGFRRFDGIDLSALQVIHANSNHIQSVGESSRTGGSDAVFSALVVEREHDSGLLVYVLQPAAGVVNQSPHGSWSGALRPRLDRDLYTVILSRQFACTFWCRDRIRGTQ